MTELNTLYVVHHSHTDIGFTSDQPIIWELQRRFIDDALCAAEHFRNLHPFESQFRWTIETSWPLMHWLKTASKADVARLQQLEQEGLIEVTAMPLNITPLYDQVQYQEALRHLQVLRETYGFRVTSAMNCDVNGHNWALSDVLLDHGIQGFSMAINHHFGGAPQPRPWVFEWEAPSGRTLPAFNGWTYGKAKDLGLDDSNPDRFRKEWQKVKAALKASGYPLPFLMVQGDHPYGDNASVHVEYARFARMWNELGEDVRVVCATPRMFWDEVQKHREKLPVWRGDWTDYWNFGCISTARETSIDRQNRARLWRADLLHALTPEVPQQGMLRTRWAKESFRLHRDNVWHQVNLWGEHTWGADCAIGTPETDDSLAQKNHKFHAVYLGRSLSVLLERDAIGDFSQLVERGSPEDLLVVNPLPFDCTISGKVPLHTLIPRGNPQDTTATRHFQGHYDWPTCIWTGQNETHLGGNLGYFLKPVVVPASGYRVVSREHITDFRDAVRDSAWEVSNHRYTLKFDPEHGGITSMWDGQLHCEWVDAREHTLLGFVHEEVADRGHSWPRRLIYDLQQPTATDPGAWQTHWEARYTRPHKVLQHHVYHHELGTSVEQVLEHPHVGRLVQRTFLPEHADWIELETEFLMGQDAHPQGTYLMFPFHLPGAQVTLNAAQTPFHPEADQIPGSCRDYFTVQDWVDFNNGSRGMVVALPDNPMVQLGGFHFGRFQQQFELQHPTLLSWITNNSWETNFQPHQAGLVVARNRLMPYGGSFDEGQAHRFGLETLHARPWVQHLHEPARTLFPAQGSLLHFPEAPFVVLQVRGLEDGQVEVTLLNASDQEREAVIASGVLRVVGAQSQTHQVAVSEDHVSACVSARRRCVLVLQVGVPMGLNPSVLQPQTGT